MEGEELLRRYAVGERDFSWVDSVDADEELRGVVLRDINLSGVDFSYCTFKKANFTGANLRDAIEFFNCHIDDSIFSNTIMPNGSIWYDSIGYEPRPVNVRKSR